MQACMKVALAQLVAILVLALFAQGLGAQTDDIRSGFKKLDAAEEQRLRAVLAEPVPRGTLLDTLRQHFLQKEEAALSLSDDMQREVVLRAAVAALPDLVFKSGLAGLLWTTGRGEEGIRLMREVVAQSDPFGGAFRLAAVARYNVQQNDQAAGRAAIEEVFAKIKSATPIANSDIARYELARAFSIGRQSLSLLEERLGHFPLAIEAATLAERDARNALLFVSKTPYRGPRDKALALILIGQSIERKLNAYREGGRLQDAENALAEYLRFAADSQLPSEFLSRIYVTAGRLRFSQREFAQSEQLTRKADTVLESLGRALTRRTDQARDIVLALSGQQRWADALREVERLDLLAGDDVKLKNLVRFSFERAVVYLGNRRYAEAAALFDSVAQENRERYPDTHFFVAQPLGLQGAALWRTGISESKAKALPLLKTAVRDYMAPANADFLENIGIRKELREIVFAAYLEATAESPGEDVTQAIGAADWVRGGVVQEALGDAAVRAAANTPELVDVVRREQDAKNEVAGIRRFLTGETGTANSPLPGIAAKMRERIAVLEGERAKLQIEIKAKFPDYERLVRPVPPTVQDIARQLELQQALLLLLPTPEAVYVWAVVADRPAGFVRVALPEAQVNALVTGLRHQLDFAYGSATGTRYDSAAAFELYDKWLAPLAKVWQGRPN